MLYPLRKPTNCETTLTAKRHARLGYHVCFYKINFINHQMSNFDCWNKVHDFILWVGLVDPICLNLDCVNLMGVACESNLPQLWSSEFHRCGLWIQFASTLIIIWISRVRLVDPTCLNLDHPMNLKGAACGSNLPQPWSSYESQGCGLWIQLASTLIIVWISRVRLVDPICLNSLIKWISCRVLKHIFNSGYWLIHSTWRIRWSMILMLRYHLMECLRIYHLSKWNPQN